MTQRICLLGAGGLGREIQAWLDEHVVGFVDTRDEMQGKEVAGLPILGRPEDVPIADGLSFLCAVGSPRIKRLLVAGILARGGHMLALPPRMLGARSEFGVSCAFDGVRVSPDCRVADYVHLSAGVVVGHDSEIGAYCHIGEGVFIGGECRIEEDVVIHPRACISRGVVIGKGAEIGLGAVVLRDVPAEAVMVGNPARRVG
ncbi:glycosyl transferase [Bordetella holmesii]|uniref:Sugar O-acyltransferase, sialic acid O-acetyltransferase NeuD family n=2 Tax=Bordetella holmesii TaxID=35814 RepID=A0A158M2D1_9BORD|nr:glycosyl transferase [Bordetella holmesii]AHV91290.1 bacterial transferase hexapeptide family protein [Bordetella holmesii ATCC 51541]AIT26533.1 bacterial transferase hexapeptide family protein [Bordetella holmesii 44057]EWM44279.1 bacterial transferase hexapeptide family protein [Bordetella holmesii 41130]EWM47111.1 bacterial transferase hexapeptide family protein [Bordetella holmesii 35009]EWM51275.1 bacterial transferase hexapeptide family protein [Bordetella holmesii 70147]